jgi:hydroxyacylglutathione hydrolase
MFLQAFADNPFATNCWLLARSDRDEALVVDPGFEAERVRALLAAAGKRPVAVLATHGHYDHIGGVRDLCGDSLPLYIHKDDEPALTDARAWGSGFDAPPVGRPADTRTVSDGEVIDHAGFELEVLHTPGHTPGSVCFRFDASIFSGDLVFLGSIGRSDFPNSSEEQMRASLVRFLALPDDVAVYPGHDQVTTVAAERATNPFLRHLA